MATAVGTSSIDIEAAPEKVLAVVLDVDAYPKWVDGVKESRVTERDAQGRPARASFIVDVKVKTVRYDLTYSYQPNGVSWEIVPGGEVKEIKGSYTLTRDGAKTHVIYDYAIDPGFPLPGPIRRQAVKIIVSTALKGLKKRVEKSS